MLAAVLTVALRTEVVEVLDAQGGMMVLLGGKTERVRKRQGKGTRTRRWHNNVLCGCWRGCCLQRLASCWKVDGGGGVCARAIAIAIAIVAERVARRRNGNGKFGLDGFLVAEGDKLQSRLVG